MFVVLDLLYVNKASNVVLSACFILFIVAASAVQIGENNRRLRKENKKIDAKVIALTENKQALINARSFMHETPEANCKNDKLRKALGERIEKLAGMSGSVLDFKY